MTNEDAYIQGFIDKCAEHGIKEAGLPRALKNILRKPPTEHMDAAFDLVGDDNSLKARAVLAMLQKARVGATASRELSPKMRFGPAYNIDDIIRQGQRHAEAAQGNLSRLP